MLDPVRQPAKDNCISNGHERQRHLRQALPNPQLAKDSSIPPSNPGQHWVHQNYGDEERMDIGLRKFVKDHPDLFEGVDALIGEGGEQSAERRRRRRRRLGRAASTSS